MKSHADRATVVPPRAPQVKAEQAEMLTSFRETVRGEEAVSNSKK